ncbi:MAG: hypothetical protein H5U21_02505 [Porphyrobacter sp.]|nr:hypothetical protein [Porphyrobacter sp.]
MSSGAGVEALIERLHRDGVEAGRAEAERLLAAARSEADALQAEARAERERLLAEARIEADALRRAGEAALALAHRDAVLRTRETLSRLFADRLGRCVAGALDEPAMLVALVRAAGQALAGQGQLDVAVHGPALDRLTEALAAELIEEGIAITSDLPEPGIRARRAGEAVVIELTDATIGAFLLAHLAPRFRALLEDARAPAQVA